MTTQATVNPQNSSGVTDALKTAGKIADVALDFGLLKKGLKNAVEDAILELMRPVTKDYEYQRVRSK